VLIVSVHRKWAEPETHVCRRLSCTADLGPQFLTEAGRRYAHGSTQKPLRRLRFLPKERSGIVQVKAEGNPPNQVVGHTKNPRLDRPDPAPDEAREADGTQDLPRKTDRCYHPASFGYTRHLKIQDAVQTQDHAEAGKDLWMVLLWHPRKMEQPLWIASVRSYTASAP
jgi:hypothetical protein